MTDDPFRPQHHPARSIYDAFQAEAAKRSGRSFEEWMAYEATAVLNSAKVNARRLGLIVPTRQQVLNAQKCALGHVDFGAKWAYAVVRIMRGSRGT